MPGKREFAVIGYWDYDDRPNAEILYYAKDLIDAQNWAKNARSAISKVIDARIRESDDIDIDSGKFTDAEIDILEQLGERDIVDLFEHLDNLHINDVVEIVEHEWAE